MICPAWDWLYIFIACSALYALHVPLSLMILAGGFMALTISDILSLIHFTEKVLNSTSLSTPKSYLLSALSAFLFKIKFHSWCVCIFLAFIISSAGLRQHVDMGSVFK